MAVELKDYSLEVKAALDEAMIAYLYEAGGEMEAQVKRNTRVGKGDLKNSWTHIVDESEGEATIGSPLENAIWEEFGTGEYALHGDGRKGGWHYQDEEGEWHHTYGKTPHRAFQRAFTSLKEALKNRALEVLKERIEK
jgi:hypothetical protein